MTAPKSPVARPEAGDAEALRRQLLAEVGEGEEAPGQLDALLDRAYLARIPFGYRFDL